MATEPLEPPEQETLDTVPFKTSAVGCVTVALALAVQELPSVITTE